MEQKGVSPETKKANIKIAIILAIVAFMGAFSTIFMLSDKL